MQNHFEELKRLPVPFPSPSHQHHIAAYLDEQTGKIDRLMEMRRRQMALLKEQRAALIQQAVTRGLNSNAPLKDSGLPWLGEIPAHWKTTRLVHHTTKIGDGLHGTPEYVDESPYHFVNGNNLSGGAVKITSTTGCVSEDEFKRHRVDLGKNTLLMSINGTIGNVAYYEGESIILGKSAAYINCANGLSRHYLFYFLQSKSTENFFQLEVTGTTIFNLSLASIRNLTVVLPSLDEQRQIVNFIEMQCASLDSLFSAYAHQLTLLTEYRASLIHECVTGRRAVSQRTTAEAPPAKANVHFRRAVLCSEIVHRLHQEPTFGRVKLEKILFLSEAYVGIDLEGQYQRAAAGPFDNRALRSAEIQIQKQHWYQPVKGAKGTRYLPMEKAGSHQKYFSRYWPTQQEKFDRLVKLLRSFDTERCEIVATLFAVWQDRQRAEQPCIDADIVEEVLTQWHPSKQRIPRERWLHALQWMKQEGLTP